MVKSETGVQFSQKFPFSWGQLFIKEKGSFIFEKPFGNTFTTSFAGLPEMLSITALSQNLNLASIGLELFAEVGKKVPVGVSLRYEGEFSSQYASNELMLSFSRSF